MLIINPASSTKIIIAAVLTVSPFFSTGGRASASQDDGNRIICSFTRQFDESGESDYRIMEVVLVKNGKSGTEKTSTQMLTVDNHWDTLRYVQENMDD